MTNLTALSDITHSGVTHMALKEITDLLEVRHDKSMLKVEEMAKEPEFGWMSKMDIQYSSGKGNGALGITHTLLPQFTQQGTRNEQFNCYPK